MGFKKDPRRVRVYMGSLDNIADIFVYNPNVSIQSPPVDTILKKDGSLLIYVDMPGVSIEDVEVFIQDGYLVVGGIKKQFCSNPSICNYHLVERRDVPYRCVMKLNFQVNELDIKYTLENGVLNIVCTKKDLDGENYG